MSTITSTLSKSTRVIRPVQPWVSLKLRELWERRELLWFLIWRDLKVRYKQTVLGFLWALVHPIMAVFVYGLFFGWLIKVPSDGVPYGIFAFAGLLPWYLLSNSISSASGSLISNQHLITKVEFPRLVLPITSVVIATIDFAISLLALAVLMVAFQQAPTAGIVLLPVFAGLAAMLGLGVGTWLAAFNAQYRDVGQAIPFALQVWLFGTPIFYPRSLVPIQWQWLFDLNPMVAVVEGFRWALFGVGNPPGAPLALSFAIAGVIVVSGFYVFRRLEQTLADVV